MLPQSKIKSPSIKENFLRGENISPLKLINSYKSTPNSPLLLLEDKKLVPQGTAKKRRELYIKRHSNDIHTGKGKLAYLLLWS